MWSMPLGKGGRMPMIALSDLGFFARYTFDHRTETSAQNLKIASGLIGGDDIASTLTKVTGKKAVFQSITVEEWFAGLPDADAPVAVGEHQKGDGSTTWGEDFSGWWWTYRDNVLKRDMDWIRSVHPKLQTLEGWMRETGYDGSLTSLLLKTQGRGLLRSI